MGLRCGMRTTKCQLLVTSLCVMLLGLSIATLCTVTHYGLHFSLLSNISLESNPYRVIHHTAFYFGICLSMTLILAALLSSAATVRESQCLTAMGFFCFALAFCGLIPAACWRYTHSTEVEDSMMDVYDLVYEEVRRNVSSFRRHELTAIHEAVSCLSALAENLALWYLRDGFSRLGPMPVFCLVDAPMLFSLGNRVLQPAVKSASPSYSSFPRFGKPDYQRDERATYLSIDLVQDLQRFHTVADMYILCFSAGPLPCSLSVFLCCGKHSPFGDTANVEDKTCPSSQLRYAGQDCLQEIRDFLKKHMDFVSTLLGVTIGFMVYGMILTSFLWFSIHFSSNLERKGKYILRER